MQNAVEMKGVEAVVVKVICDCSTRTAGWVNRSRE